jgi:hypothetical protein
VVDAYVLLVTAEVDLPLLALVAQTGDVMGKVASRTLLSKDRRGIGCRTGHMKVADLVGAAREVAQGNELDGSGSCHCDGCVVGGLELELYCD